MKRQYIQPAIIELAMEAQPILAGSGELEKEIDDTTEVDESFII